MKHPVLAGVRTSCVLVASVLLAPLAALAELPEDVRVSPTGTTTARIEWTAPAGGEGYRVERSTDLVDWVGVATVDAATREHLADGLVAGRFYGWRVRPVSGRAMGPGEAWNFAVQPALVGDPDQQYEVELRATWRDDRTCALRWEDPFGDETAWEIRRQSAGGADTLVASLPPDTTDWTDPTPHPFGTSVSYTVTARGPGTTTSGAAAARIFTALTFAQGAVLSSTVAAPTGLVATSPSGSRIDLTWQDNSTNESGFVILASWDGVRYQSLASVPANSTGYSWDWAWPGLVNLRVAAFQGGSYSPPSPSVSASVRAANPGLPAPVRLQATQIGNSITLSWEAEENDRTGFAIERITASPSGNVFGFREIAVLPATTRTHALASASSSDRWRVRSLYGADFSPYSNVASIRFPPFTRQTTAATGLSATALASHRVALAWSPAKSDDGTAVVPQLLQRSVAGGDWETVDHVKAGAGAYVDNQAVPGVSHRYRIRSYVASDAFASTSAEISITPPAGPAFQAPTAPVQGGDSVVVRRVFRRSFHELVVEGSSGNDRISVTGNSDGLVVTVDGAPVVLPVGAVQRVVVQAGSGDDVVSADVAAPLRIALYGGPGRDELTALGDAKAALLDIDAQADMLTGNGRDTSYWADERGVDVVRAGAAEIASGRVHRVRRYHQPWTQDPTNAHYVHKTTRGANWPDGIIYDGKPLTRNTDSSFWGLGVSLLDVDQGTQQDCPQTSLFQGVAHAEPDRLSEVAVDLGDGTFALQFFGLAPDLYLRVDADVYPFGVSQVGPSGNQWWPILEKAFAFGLNLTPSVYLTPSAEAGVFEAFDDPELVYAWIRASLARGELMSPFSRLSTGNTIYGRRVSLSHAHSLVGAFRDASGKPRVIVRNPYGQEYDYNSLPRDPRLGLSVHTIPSLVANFSLLGGSRPTFPLQTFPDETDGTVVVSASDPEAAERGLDRGEFTLSRGGFTGASLVVAFELGGTAAAGEDFASPGMSVTIPAGASTATVPVRPLLNPRAAGTRTVRLTLVPAAGYTLGESATTLVDLRQEDDIPGDANGDGVVNAEDLALALARDGADVTNLEQVKANFGRP